MLCRAIGRSRGQNRAHTIQRSLALLTPDHPVVTDSSQTDIGTAKPANSALDGRSEPPPPDSMLLEASGHDWPVLLSFDLEPTC